MEGARLGGDVKDKTNKTMGVKNMMRSQQVTSDSLLHCPQKRGPHACTSAIHALITHVSV